MVKYETIFVAQPRMTEDEFESLRTSFEEVIGTNGGTVVQSENWGKRRLAYRVQKHEEGFYAFLLYDGTGSLVRELERRFRLNEEVIKFLSVKAPPEGAKIAGNPEFRRRPAEPAETAAPAAGAEGAPPAAAMKAPGASAPASTPAAPAPASAAPEPVKAPAAPGPASAAPEPMKAPAAPGPASTAPEPVKAPAAQEPASAAPAPAPAAPAPAEEPASPVTPEEKE